MELARETATLEQYWIVGDRSEPRKPPKNYNYVEELMHLQIELIKMQECVRHNRLKMCAIFEGRDAAGKGGVIEGVARRARADRAAHGVPKSPPGAATRSRTVLDTRVFAG